ISSSPEISPAARRLAQELGIDLAQVQGTGPGGRIRQEDVRLYAERTRPPVANIEDNLAADRWSGTPDPAVPQEEAFVEVSADIIPLSPMRRAIAQRLEDSVRKIPHFFLTVEVDMTQAVALRTNWTADQSQTDHGQSDRDQGSAPPSYTAILVNTIAKILPAHPYLNAAFMEREIRLYKEINIGVAVAVDGGLIIPVIRRADQMSLTEIEASLTQLQQSARAGKFEAAQLQGGTFTISNLGMYGIDECTSLINPPQSAILAAGQVAKRPVVRDDALVALPTMILTLSADHRVLDGATAARFLSAVKVELERPNYP
ncbi:MAG: 2-oxo acid dehydrogenase subunit E2, partial [Chloroflexi bacterium]|nr:2-oxo acid dehydrogenase subunit E2 [Chloroflexota bacterium]